MSREKEEMQSVTIRIPKYLYVEYKQALLEQGRIVTYDVRKHMNEVVENHKEGQKNA
ncbi:MAG: transcriptional regulator [Candidatus Moranbacteria bacterium]|nr:transcriptional regulator [Candidatus Moranbacteria bacterium]